MFRIPPQGSDAREKIGDLAYVAELLNPANAGELPTIREAVRQARKALDATPAAKSICSIVLACDDDRLLIEVTRRTWRKLWNFSRDEKGRLLH